MSNTSSRYVWIIAIVSGSMSAEAIVYDDYEDERPGWPISRIASDFRRENLDLIKFIKPPWQQYRSPVVARILGMRTRAARARRPARRRASALSLSQRRRQRRRAWLHQLRATLGIT